MHDVTCGTRYTCEGNKQLPAFFMYLVEIAVSAHHAVHPPSTTRLCPVQCAEAAEAR